MRDKTTSLALAIGIIFFVLIYAVTDGLKSSNMVASSQVHVSSSAPTVNDDIDRGFLPGAVWIDQSANISYIAITTADGSANWDQTN